MGLNSESAVALVEPAHQEIVHPRPALGGAERMIHEPRLPAHDLDLIAWGGRVARGADLQLPHPRLAERDFVLAPLAELAPDWIPPGQSRSVSSLLTALPEAAEVKIIGSRSSPT